MGATPRRLSGLLLCALLAHCGRAGETEPRREPGGWLASCLVAADCGQGECICGVCTASCAQAGCSAGPPGSECIQPEHWAHAGFCAGRSSEPICVLPCTETSECSGSDQCVQGVCVPEAAAIAATGDPLSEPLCAANPVVYRSLLVTDQAQLDLLAGCEVIEGSLTLQLFPDADATALASLREVTGTLTIDSDAGSTLPLPAFPRLEAARNLTLQDLDIGAPDRFPALRTLGQPERLSRPSGQLYLLRCTGLTDLSQFRHVQGIRKLVLSSNPDLARLEGIESLADLADLEVRGNERLTTFVGLGDTPALDSVQIAANAVLESLAGLPPSLRSISLYGNDALQTLEGLEALTHVGMTIMGNSSLRSLAALGGLESASGLLIESNAALTSLAGLTALRSVGSLWVRHNPALASFGSWPALETISDLEIIDNPALQSVASLGAATIGDVTISESALVDLGGFEDVSVDGGLSVSNNTALATLRGAPTLGPAAQLSIIACPNLTDLSALASVTRLGGISLTNVGLVNLDAFSRLERLGSLELRENQNLVHADALSAVSGLGNLVADANPALERLPTFPNVVTLAGESPIGALLVSVTANEQLTEPPAFPFVDRASVIRFDSNPNLPRVTGFAALAAVASLELVNNTLLAELDFSNLREAGAVTIMDNPLLAPDQIAPLLELAPTPNAEELP